MKTSCFSVDLPTRARDLAMAVGQFDIVPDVPPSPTEAGLQGGAYMSSDGARLPAAWISHFVPGDLLPELVNTASFLSEAMMYYARCIPISGRGSIWLPFDMVKFVYVCDTYDGNGGQIINDYRTDLSAPSGSVALPYLYAADAAYATLNIISINDLYPARVIDAAFHTRRLLSHALALQYFGRFFTEDTPEDEWLVYGLAAYFAGRYARQLFGTNAHRLYMHRLTAWVCAQEDPGLSDTPPHCPLYHDHASCASCRAHAELAREFLVAKGHVVLHMMERRYGAGSGRVGRSVSAPTHAALVPLCAACRRLLILRRRATGLLPAADSARIPCSGPPCSC